MRKIIYTLVSALLLSIVPEILSAQSNDPFEQETLKSTGNTVRREKKISRKKNSETEEQSPVINTPNTNTQKPAEPKKNTLSISNPCDEWLDFEFVSLVGSRGSQTMKMTIKVTNHRSNSNMRLANYFISFDDEGVEHNDNGFYSSTSKEFNMITDVPVKYSFEIPGKANPNTVKMMAVICFNIGDECRIELRNVPIDWK
ncbi:MAG: hypothetical protein ACI358_00380 [Candidatus Limimorpha sp.]